MSDLPEAAVQAAAEVPQRIEDLSSSLPFSEADVQAFFAAMDDRGPSYEQDLRADERRKVAEEIRDLAKDDDRYGLANFRAFIKRHKRLVHGESVPAVLLAVADEIEGEDP